MYFKQAYRGLYHAACTACIELRIGLGIAKETCMAIYTMQQVVDKLANRIQIEGLMSNVTP